VVSSIGEYAFYNCDGLMSITIPMSVTSIDRYAFINCYKLVEVYNLSMLNITEKDTANGYAGYYALKIYTDLSAKSKVWTTDDGFTFFEDGVTCYLIGYSGEKANITLPVSCHGKNYAIYQYAFCVIYNNLVRVTIPNGVTSIGEHVFGCERLMSITISDSVTSIGVSAFRGCGSLTSVTIGKGVTDISDGAFSWCGKLTTITFNGTKSQWANILKASDWDQDTGEYTIRCTDGVTKPRK